MAAAVARFGRIDALVNNAGYGLWGPLEDISESEMRRQFDTNFLGQWRLVAARGARTCGPSATGRSSTCRRCRGGSRVPCWPRMRPRSTRWKP